MGIKAKWHETVGHNTMPWCMCTWDKVFKLTGYCYNIKVVFQTKCTEVQKLTNPKCNAQLSLPYVFELTYVYTEYNNFKLTKRNIV